MTLDADTIIINKAKADLQIILEGSVDLETMRVASLRIKRLMAQAISKKAKAIMPSCIEPTAEEIAVADAIKKELAKLSEIGELRERMYDALEANGVPLTVADVKRVLKGTVLFVIEAQTYDTVTRLDNTSYMFEECSPSEPLGYFQGEEDTDADVATVGSGSDVWYLANAATLDALKKCSV
jgi:hypothetical protein